MGHTTKKQQRREPVSVTGIYEPTPRRKTF